MTLKKAFRIGLTVILGLALIQAYDGEPLLFFNYFTNTGNVIIFVLMLGILFEFIPEKHIILGVMIGLVINIVYVNLLIDDYAIISDIVDSEWQWGVLHYLVPYVLLIDFIWGVQEAMPKLRTLIIYLVIPVTYLIYAFIYGSLTGTYAYFFLDVPLTGITGVLLYIFGIIVFYLVLGSTLLYFKTNAEKKRLH